MIDTLKNVGIGTGGFAVQFMNGLPDFLKIGVGLVTLCYLIIKIRKEYR